MRAESEGRKAMRAATGAGLLLACVVAAACGGTDTAAARRRGGRGTGPAAMESTTAATPAATAGAAAAETRNRTRDPKGLFLGTSLTAGLGLADPATEAWPAVIQQLADSAGLPFRVVNAGLSGETSAGALRRADWLLRERYEVIVVETGANDGLRGLEVDSTAANIKAIIAKAKAASPGAAIYLLQMEAPTNMGPKYTKAFHGIFPRVAMETGVTLLPFLLDGVAGIAKYNQPDGIHPTAEGARMAAHNVWPGLRYALRHP